MYTARISHEGRLQGGFTLLELLISITMLCLILLIAGSAVRLGIRSVTSGEKRMEAIERFSSSLNIVDAQIQSELPIAQPGSAGTNSVSQGDGASNPNTVFQGDSASMQFQSIYSIWGHHRGYVTVSYNVVPGPFGKQELHAEESATGAASRGEVNLFKYFDRIYFDYYHKDPAAEEGTWIGQWQDNSTVPEKIRLHLVTGDSEMTFIIPVKVKDVQNGSTVIAPNG